MKLNEIATVNRLSSTEQGILGIVHISDSPRVAYDNTTGTQQLMVAQDKLMKYGLLNVTNNMAQLTDKGLTALVRYNIIDSTQTITDYGEDIINNTNEDKSEWNNTR